VPATRNLFAGSEAKPADCKQQLSLLGFPSLAESLYNAEMPRLRHPYVRTRSQQRERATATAVFQTATAEQVS